MKKNTFKDDCHFTLTYLDYRNSFYMGYVPYSIYKRRISYILKTNTLWYLRKIFNWMLVKKYVKKKRVLGRVMYLFNPYNLDEEILRPSGLVVFQ
mgnify:FL=1